MPSFKQLQMPPPVAVVKEPWHGHGCTSSSASSGDREESNEVCWICLDGEAVHRPLHRVCKCPRVVHRECIARWQLQSAGSNRETRCEFCAGQLPDWKESLTPASGCNSPAVMNVNFDGRTYAFEVSPGPSGYRQFTEAIRATFGLPIESELNISFTCDEPTIDPIPAANSLLTLNGAGAYDAAVHCAAVSAARRAASGCNSPTGPLSCSHHNSFSHGSAARTISSTSSHGSVVGAAAAAVDSHHQLHHVGSGSQSGSPASGSFGRSSSHGSSGRRSGTFGLHHAVGAGALGIGFHTLPAEREAVGSGSSSGRTLLQQQPQQQALPQPQQQAQQPRQQVQLPLQAVFEEPARLLVQEMRQGLAVMNTFARRLRSNLFDLLALP